MIELTLRTPCALDAIKAIANEVPEICVGAGTIVEPVQAAQAAEAGAQFLVSPGSTETLLKAMTDTGLPHLPGAATVSEVLFLLERGYRELKFFPRRGVGWREVPRLDPLTRSGGTVLPHRRYLDVERRGGLPVAAQRRLRRRILAHARRRREAEGLGPDQRPRA